MKEAYHVNLKLIHGDFLNYKLPAWGDYKVIANIPYFITTQIIEKLTNGDYMPTDIWLTIEKGAAKRFMGVPRETQKSLLLKVEWEKRTADQETGGSCAQAGGSATCP